jgi:hypothetical protein
MTGYFGTVSNKLHTQFPENRPSGYHFEMEKRRDIQIAWLEVGAGNYQVIKYNWKARVAHSA